jgi:hypothetical protein
LDVHDQIAKAQQRGFWAWLLGTAASFGIAFGLLPGGSREVGLWALGALFALNVAMYAGLARRFGPGAAIMTAWGLGFGGWFPAWVEAAAPLSRDWLVRIGWTDQSLIQALPGPAAIAVAGATTGALMYLLTASWRVVLQTGLLSLVVAATPLLKNHEEGAVIAGVIAWHVGVSGSLYRWMMDCVRGGAGLACAGCGFDLIGLSSPVCPGCGRMLGRKEAIAVPGRRPAVATVPKPVGRWY